MSFSHPHMQSGPLPLVSETPFGEVRTAEATTIWEIKSCYGLSNLRDLVTLTSSGAVTNDGAEYAVTSGATANSEAVLETQNKIRYMAGILGTPGCGIRIPTLPTGTQGARWGVFGDDNGFGVGIDAEGLYVFRRRDGVETVQRRSAWIDRMDGTGASGATLNPADATIYRMPFRWYGSGPIMFETSIQRDLSRPGMATFASLAASGETITGNPNQRMRVEVYNGADGGAFTVYVAGRHYSVQGRYTPSYRITPQERIGVSVGSSAFVPLVTFRQKAANDTVSVKLSDIDVVTSGADVVWAVRLFSTLTGASYAVPNDIAATETALEFDTSATALSGGQVIFKGMALAGVGSRSGQDDAMVPQLDLPVGVVVVLCAKAISGTATVNAILTAREEW